METQLIVTHPGSAHFDEVTAVSLIMASFPETEFKVERREPTVAELEDPAIWVVDVGDRHEPEKRNFDHHQSLDCPAGFVLVANFLGLSETLSVLPWWGFKDSVDRFGVVRSSIKFNAGDELVNRNPMEMWLTSRFASATQDYLTVLKSYGAYVIASARVLKRQLDYWKSCSRLNIAGVPAIIGETRESAGLEEFRRSAENPPDIIISMDRRSDGWRLFRYEGTPVDFSRLIGEPEIAFAHKSGFMAKTHEHMPEDQLIALVSKAVIKRK